MPPRSPTLSGTLAPRRGPCASGEAPPCGGWTSTRPTLVLPNGDRLPISSRWPQGAPPVARRRPPPPPSSGSCCTEGRVPRAPRRSRIAGRWGCDGTGGGGGGIHGTGVVTPTRALHADGHPATVARAFVFSFSSLLSEQSAAAAEQRHCSPVDMPIRISDRGHGQSCRRPRSRRHSRGRRSLQYVLPANVPSPLTSVPRRAPTAAVPHTHPTAGPTR